METIYFTKEERYVIAEYIYSHKQDILIKSDALKLIDVLNKYNLIEDAKEWKNNVRIKFDEITSEALLLLIYEGILLKQVKEILNEYYKN
jgi:hypothetical protein